MKHEVEIQQELPESMFNYNLKCTGCNWMGYLFTLEEADDFKARHLQQNQSLENATDTFPPAGE